MAVTAHVFPSFTQALYNKTINWSTDSFYCLLVASSGTAMLGGTASPNVLTSTTESMTTLASAKANGSNALTEVSGSGTGYTTNGIPLTAADFSITDSGAVTTLAYSGTISLSSATFTAYQALFYDATAASGAGQVICYWDFGSAQTCSNGTFTLTLGSGNALVTWTAS